MYGNTTIQLRRSNTAFAIPTANQLQLGEPAINLTDGRLFVKLSTGAVIDISSTPAGNTYYVSQNGSDLFDGKTPSAAKATIRAAVAAASPGDSVYIHGGVYTEKTPIILPQQVQISGAGERNTIIKPQDPTKDIFWMSNNGYVTAVKFIDYSANAISFPAAVIESGTAQAVTSNTITLASTSEIYDNYYNSMQVNITGGTNASLVYDPYYCIRDTGYLLDSVSFDLLYGGNKQSVQSAVYHYNYTNVSAIPVQTTQSVAAYNHLSLIAGQIILGQTVTRYQNVITQNTSVSFGTASEVATIQNNVNTIISIINSGPSITGIGTNLPKIPINLTANSSAGVSNAATILEVNRSFMQAETIAWIANTYPSLVYNTAKCSRDTGLIIDAITQDMLFNTKSQSTFAGLQYWQQNGYTGNLGSQITATVGAINYISSLAQKIILNDQTGTRYQNLIHQNVNVNLPSNSVAVNNILTEFSTITNILNTGNTTGVTDIIVPNSIVANNNLSIVNAYKLLQANKKYIQAETLAWVEANKFVNVANIISYSANTKIATLDKNWTALPSNNCQYSLSIPLRKSPASSNTRFTTFITGSPYIYNSSSISPLGGTGLSIDGRLSTGNKSMISSQFTQVNTGGRGVHILNDGYSQLVSIYAIFCDTAYQADTGGTASLGNCDVNFGNFGLVSNGKGSLAMTALINGTQSANTFTMNLNSIRANSEFVSANIPYSGLVMYIDGDSAGNWYNVSEATALDVNGNSTITFLQSNSTSFSNNTEVYFYQQSQLRASGQTFEYVGAGTNINAIPRLGGIANSQTQMISIAEGSVFATSTDEKGNFQVGDLILNQASSTISGRTFSKSLFAQMTPYILALEG